MNRYERFVLIDDNEADNVYHEIMIRRAGFAGEVVVFESGPDALAFFEKDPGDKPTCIFLDINMPMMDGFEVAEKATPWIEKKQAVILVMLTSSDNPLDKERARAIKSIKGYVTKPLDVPKLKVLLAGQG